MPKLHVFSAEYSRANYFREGDRIRTHFVFEWNAKTRRNMSNGTLVAWMKLINACGGLGAAHPPDVKEMFEIAGKCFYLCNEPHYSQQDGGPWAIATPRNVATHNELMNYIERNAVKFPKNYWSDGLALCREFATLYKRHLQTK